MCLAAENFTRLDALFLEQIVLVASAKEVGFALRPAPGRDQDFCSAIIGCFDRVSIIEPARLRARRLDLNLLFSLARRRILAQLALQILAMQPKAAVCEVNVQQTEAANRVKFLSLLTTCSNQYKEFDPIHSGGRSRKLVQRWLQQGLKEKLARVSSCVVARHP